MCKRQNMESMLLMVNMKTAQFTNRFGPGKTITLCISKMANISSAMNSDDQSFTMGLKQTQTKSVLLGHIVGNLGQALRFGKRMTILK